MADQARYFEPVAEESPAGEDLTGGTALHALRSLARQRITERIEDGKMVATAEKPEWRKVLTAAEAALARSRHLEVAVYYSAARLHIAGLEGAVEGLELIGGMLRNLWPNLHPLPDRDETEPARERMAILENLSQDQKPVDPFQFVTTLRRIPLLGDVSLQVLQNSKRPGILPEEVGDPEARIRAIADAEPDRVTTVVSLLDRALAAVQEMRDFLGIQVGSEHSPNLDRLREVFLAQKTLLFDEHGEGRATPSEMPLGQSSPIEATAFVHLPKAIATSHLGEIRGNGEVIRILDQLCVYYQQVEPSSPVPLLLQRAKRLVGKPFLDLLEDLAASGLDEARKVAGITIQPSADS